ncbi:ferritin-like domain-containing protein [Sphingomonas sp.]|uniref:ferritin-like domain-containing protein n=1 Tax=Sphingomonas sp. TaxID=28214 RepID=UPI00286E17E5|nr:ferritin-like domain-containing protein [Sphingomonas sp.]
MLQRLRQRYLDVLGSIYIYNEHRGYSSIDRIIRAARAAWPDDAAFLAELEAHRRDERKHYLMFRRWFEARGRMPLSVDRTCGHIDRLVRLTFGCHVDDLDEAAIAADPALFAKLCRIIVLTEQRGMRQVDILLQSSLIHGDARLHKIFKVIEADEPSHWAPYQAWLERNRGGAPRRSERIADWLVHRTLLLIKLPALFLNPRVKRRAAWQDDSDPSPLLAG